MTAADQTTPSGASYSLPNVLDTSALQTLMEDLREQLQMDADFAIEASQVDRVGTPAIQLLLSASKTAAKTGKKIYLVHPSQALCSAFHDLGLEAELEQWRKLPW